MQLRIETHGLFHFYDYLIFIKLNKLIILQQEINERVLWGGEVSS